jgi:hypothetical protein
MYEAVGCRCTRRCLNGVTSHAPDVCYDVGAMIRIRMSTHHTVILMRLTITLTVCADVSEEQVDDVILTKVPL